MDHPRPDLTGGKGGLGSHQVDTGSLKLVERPGLGQRQHRSVAASNAPA